MKQPIRILFIVLINMFCGVLHLYGAIGCMDNSWHLARCYDDKEYHFVSCNCPCSRYQQRDDRGQCVQCLHYHEARPIYTVTRNDVYAHTAVATQTIRTTKKALKNNRNPFAHVFEAYPLQSNTK